MTPTVASVATSGLEGGYAPSRPARWHHWLAVFGCLGIFLLGALLEPALPGKPGLSVAGHRLPESCMFYRTTGMPCPGCGLTRSVVAAVHGRLGDSFAFHRLGWAIMLYALVQAGRHGWWLARPGSRAVIDRWGGRLDYGLVALPILMVLLWLPGTVHEVWHRLGLH